MKLRYAPTEKGYVPGLEPGQVLEVEDQDEAGQGEVSRLLETGLFALELETPSHDETAARAGDSVSPGASGPSGAAQARQVPLLGQEAVLRAREEVTPDVQR